MHGEATQRFVQMAGRNEPINIAVVLPAPLPPKHVHFLRAWIINRERGRPNLLGQLPVALVSCDLSVLLPRLHRVQLRSAESGLGAAQPHRAKPLVR